MTSASLELSSEKSASVRSVRFPALSSGAVVGVGIDPDSDAYKAGFAAGSAELASQLAAVEARHQAFANGLDTMLAELDEKYRRECLSLIERLFVAAAPTLARRSALIDILQIVEERVIRGKSELTLHINPELVSHLSEGDYRQVSENPLVNLVVDKSCPPNSIDAKWAKGGLFHDPDGLIADLISALNENNEPQEEN